MNGTRGKSWRRGGLRNALKIFSRKLMIREHLGFYNEIRYDGREWIELAQDRNQRLSRVNTVMDIPLPINLREILQHLSNCQFLKNRNSMLEMFYCSVTMCCIYPYNIASLNRIFSLYLWIIMQVRNTQHPKWLYVRGLPAWNKNDKISAYNTRVKYTRVAKNVKEIFFPFNRSLDL